MRTAITRNVMATFFLSLAKGTIMTNHTLRRLSDIDQVSLTGRKNSCARCRRRARHGSCTVALAGGFAPKLLYQHLTERALRRQVDWSMVHFFWGDERTVPPNHHDSNFGMANETLLQSLALPKDQIHRMQAERPDLDLAAGEYQTELAQVCRVPSDGEPPVLDLVLLGMGRDGHTAALFPSVPPSTKRGVGSSPTPCPGRVMSG